MITFLNYQTNNQSGKLFQRIFSIPTLDFVVKKNNNQDEKFFNFTNYEMEYLSA